MHKVIITLTIIMLSVGGCSFQKKESYKANYNLRGIDKIAIIAVIGQIQDQDAKVQIADLFIPELVNKGYSPILYSQANTTINEIAKQKKLPLPVGGYAQAGQLLNVPAVLVINIPYFGNEMSISAQIIDSKDGSVLWMDQAFGGTRASRETSSRRDQDDFLMDPLLMLNRRNTVIQSQQPMVAQPGQRALNNMEWQEARMIISDICDSLPPAQMYYPESVVTPKTTSISKPKNRNNNDW